MWPRSGLGVVGTGLLLCKLRGHMHSDASRVRPLLCKIVNVGLFLSKTLVVGLFLYNKLGFRLLLYCTNKYK